MMRRRLNLVRPDGSFDIKYKVSRFPDGQQGITIQEVYDPKEQHEIIGRLNSFSDLELILCATAALRAEGVEEILLTVPYFLGARSDRKFGQGGYHYLKDVICPIINAQGYRSVAVLDPHSDVLEACIDRLVPNSNLAFVKWALEDLGYEKKPLDFTMVAPDAGAYKKVDSIARELKHPAEIVTAHKRRDLETGQILSTTVEGIDGAQQKFVIIDDICDGGRTFLGIAEAIKSKVADAEIYLLVTHGIFSAGYSQLMNRFDGIYTTNSYRDFNEEFSFVKSLKVI
jgi:ribose-phosphate pyrophosphokinase